MPALLGATLLHSDWLVPRARSLRRSTGATSIFAFFLLLRHLFLDDNPRDVIEYLGNVLSTLCRRLEERQPVRLREPPSRFGLYHAVLAVALVRHEHLCHVLIRVLIDLLEPVLYVVEGAWSVQS